MESTENTLQTVRNALDNYSHGRRVFALRQLEELVGIAPVVSTQQAWLDLEFVRAQETLTLLRGTIKMLRGDYLDDSK